MPPNRTSTFNMKTFLIEFGEGKSVLECRPKQIIFTQGDRGDVLYYIQKGKVKLTVISGDGKEGVVGILEKENFFGEGCLVGQPSHIVTATALEDSEIVRLPKESMLRMLDTRPEFSSIFIHHLVSRNARIQENLVDLLFNSSEKRLARALLLLAHIGKDKTFEPVIPKISQETLAEMVGTTRSRVSYFMNKFRKMGFIDYNGGLKVHGSLINILLHGSSTRKVPRSTVHQKHLHRTSAM
jgi:CRP/FNR family transcriptional regulator, cyclic AMP receptor protein